MTTQNKKNERLKQMLDKIDELEKDLRIIDVQLESLQREKTYKENARRNIVKEFMKMYSED